jgi:hypothetical protein
MRDMGGINGSWYFDAYVYLAETQGSHAAFRTCADNYVYGPREDRNENGVLDKGDIPDACAPNRSVVSNGAATLHGTYDAQMMGGGGYHCEHAALDAEVAKNNPEEIGTTADPLNRLLGARCHRDPATSKTEEVCDSCYDEVMDYWWDCNCREETTVTFPSPVFPAVFFSAVQVPDLADAYDDAAMSAPEDTCNLDGICDVPDESSMDCPDDCTCGDGVCDDYESSMEGCTDDCGGSDSSSASGCGDGICDVPDESSMDCPDDCICGDGVCDDYESSMGGCTDDCGGS